MVSIPFVLQNKRTLLKGVMNCVGFNCYPVVAAACLQLFSANWKEVGLCTLLLHSCLKTVKKRKQSRSNCLLLEYIYTTLISAAFSNFTELAINSVIINKFISFKDYNMRFQTVLYQT